MSDALTELPEGWKLIRLDELFRWSNGKGLTKQQMEGGIHSVYGGNGITGTHSQWLCDQEAIVVGRVGAQCGNVHLAKACSWITDNAIYTSWKTNYVYLEFFSRLLSKLKLNELAGGSGQPYVSQSILNPLLVPLPPLNEQKRIVAKIEELRDRHQRAKQALEAIPELCDRFRQSVLAAAFRGDLTADWREENPDVEPASFLLERIRRDRRHYWEETELSKLTAKGKIPKDDKWKAKYQPPEGVDTSALPELPNNWCWASAEELTAPGRPILYGIIKPGPDTPDGIPYVRVNEMKNGTIDVTCLRKCHPDRAALFSRAILRAGDILISKDGTIGKVALVPPELEGGNITQHVLRFSPSEHISELFISRMIEAPFSQNWILSQLKGIGLLGINVEDFRRLPIPLPPLSEQIVIHELLSVYLEKILILKDCRDTADSELNLINQSILAKAFRGELVEQDPNDEPASVLLEHIRAEREKADDGKKTKGKRAKQLKLEV